LMLKEKDIDIVKYKSNVDIIKESNAEFLKYIDINHFINFLERAADQIYVYIIKEKILYKEKEGKNYDKYKLFTRKKRNKY
ncbi:MAG: hypothetical protein K2I70_02045, partial [Bacilli bacterium]|nr:hypothetical protein [Bacilli bacterium]